LTLQLYVEDRQMTQKDNSRCIEDARYKQDNLEAFELNNLKGL